MARVKHKIKRILSTITFTGVVGGGFGFFMGVYLYAADPLQFIRIFTLVTAPFLLQALGSFALTQSWNFPHMVKMLVCISGICAFTAFFDISMRLNSDTPTRAVDTIVLVIDGLFILLFAGWQYFSHIKGIIRRV